MGRIVHNSAPLDALVALVLEGAASREAVVQYLGEQGDKHASRLRAPDAVIDDHEVIGWIVGAACDLAATELKERIQSWFDDNLIDTTIAGKKWANLCMSRDFDGDLTALFNPNNPLGGTSCLHDA